MALTKNERRALRVIEEALRTEDPGLAAFLTGPSPGTGSATVRRLHRCGVALVLALVLVGLVASDPAMFFGGLVLLAMVSLVRRCYDAVIADDG